MALITSKTAGILHTELVIANNTAYGNYGIRQFLTFLETILDNAFQNATPSATNFLLTPPAGTFHIDVVNNVATPATIAKACKDYWLLAILPGSPVSCNGIDSVINDASKIEAPITAQLTALGMEQVYSPAFIKFVDIIFNNVKTIIWTIQESDSTCNSTLTGTVS